MRTSARLRAIPIHLAQKPRPTRTLHTSAHLFNAARSTGQTGKFSAYTSRLAALSSRTGVSLPSLALSFGILHELTALVPLIILFFGFQAANVGTSIVEWAGNVTEVSEHDQGRFEWRMKVKEWLAEGERRVDRVARRYGLFGYAKGVSERIGEGKGVHVEEEARELVVAAKGSKAAADITNAIAAYVLVKALLPARIGVSLAFAPAFSRRIIEPTRHFVWHRVLRKPKA